MMLNPRIGQLVQVWYRKEMAPHMPLHGRVGIVRLVSHGPGPRNHGVEFQVFCPITLIAWVICVIPCGNLRKHKGETR